MNNLFKIPKDKKIIIYGAGAIAEALIISLKEEYDDYQNWLVGCAVTSMHNNPNEIEGISVCEIDELKSLIKMFMCLLQLGKNIGMIYKKN